MSAGVSAPVAARGRYFRLLTGDYDLRVTFEYENGQQYSTPWKVGLGAQLPQPFQRILLESENAQTVEFIYSNSPVDDNRLVGDIRLQGGGNRSHSTVTVNPATATKILDADLDRIKASVYFALTGRIGADNTVSGASGFPVSSGGMWNDANTGELWVYSAGGGSVDLIIDKV